MDPNGWLVILLPNAVIVAVGFVVLWIALHRFRLAVFGYAALLLLGLLALGAGLLIETGSVVGLRCLQAGNVLLLLLAPASWLLGGAYKIQRGKRGPLTRNEWGSALLGYWLLFWVLTVGVYGLAYLVNPPPGGFR